MDAMSDAIEGADVMLYGVSLRYKESSNCRLEANVSGSKHLILVQLALLTTSASVVMGMLVCTSAGAGHDPTDDAGKL